MIKNYLILFSRLFKYNLKIVFANKFVFFLLGAFGFYLLIAIINLLDREAYFTQGDVYNLLLFPGILIIFYPSTFGIQNDVDTRMIEVLFGIPNYRYKVWLLRLVIIFIVVYGFILVLGLFSTLALLPVPIFELGLQLMFPIFFMGILGFLLSTLIRNGAGTAAVMVLIGLIVWISAGILDESEWNIFLNPYDMPESFNPAVWAEMLFYNRLYLLIASVLAILAALFRLQKRESFM